VFHQAASHTASIQVNFPYFTILNQIKINMRLTISYLAALNVGIPYTNRRRSRIDNNIETFHSIALYPVNQYPLSLHCHGFLKYISCWLTTMFGGELELGLGSGAKFRILLSMVLNPKLRFTK
jgi:hypothetical protein